jgi:hypothetical protein
MVADFFRRRQDETKPRLFGEPIDPTKVRCRRIALVDRHRNVIEKRVDPTGGIECCQTKRASPDNA